MTVVLVLTEALLVSTDVMFVSTAAFVFAEALRRVAVLAMWDEAVI